MCKLTARRTLCFGSEAQYARLLAALIQDQPANEVEHGAFLFGSQDTDGRVHVNDVTMLNPDDFVAQSMRYLELRDDVLQEMIAHAHRTNAALVEAHSHPLATGSRVCFSPFDFEGLAEIGPHVSWRLPGRPYVALVFGRDAFDSLYWEGRQQAPRGSVDLVVAGRLLRPSGDSEIYWRRNHG